jgi:putative PIN family toxin of toxin-antitoxin system
MRKRKVRVVIDTNIWISFLLSKRTSGLDQFFLDQSITVVFSQELLDEFITVIRRPKLKKYFAIADIEALLFQINAYAEFIEVNSNVNLCRDIKDNFLLALAQDSKANYLITGDKDLLVLNKTNKTQIIPLTQFLLERNSRR